MFSRRRRCRVLPLAFLAVTMLAAGTIAGPITFEEIALRDGVIFVSNASPTPEKHQPEPLVTGVAVFDYDGDGYPDIYFVNGARMPSLVKEGPHYANRLFHNNHDLTFYGCHRQEGSCRRRIRHECRGGRL